jgi:hypothetical protein
MLQQQSPSNICFRSQLPHERSHVASNNSNNKLFDEQLAGDKPTRFLREAAG